MSQSLLIAEGIRKSFNGVPALKDGRFVLQSGSVHALCGGNGAGKSTFLKILMGIHHRDGGTLERNGEAVVFDSPSEALANGICIIEQELSPVPAMSVAENIYLGREPVGFLGRVDFRKMNADAQELLDRFGFGIRAETMMMDLTVAQTQLVEIAKALSYDAEVIIMDEPTSALGEAEADQLFEAVRALKERGKGVIYVSHRLSEIFDRLFGLSSSTAGEILLGGKPVRITSPKEAIEAGLAYVTEDRKGSGLNLAGDVRDNLCLATLEEMSPAGVMNGRAEAEAAGRMISTLNIKTASDRLGVSNLSGGNQQKVVLGKWFLTQPEILLLDEPTRGVDVGAKREIYRVMSDFAAAGGTIIMVSSETDEVLGMADRAVVMRDGRVAGELDRADMSAEALLHLAV